MNLFLLLLVADQEVADQEVADLEVEGLEVEGLEVEGQERVSLVNHMQVENITLLHLELKNTMETVIMDMVKKNHTIKVNCLLHQF